MATSSAVFDTKTSDFKDAFGLLESQEKDVLESIKTLISENLESSKSYHVTVFHKLHYH